MEKIELEEVKRRELDLLISKSYVNIMICIIH